MKVEMNKITIVAILDGTTRRKDGSMSLRFITNELDKSHRGAIDDLFQSFGILYFREGESSLNDITDTLDSIDIDVYDKPKSQSARLRNVLWKNQEQELGRKPNDDEFKEYYRIKTEAIINHLKSKLE